MSFDPYAAGALIEGEHEPLVANLLAFAKTAGVAPVQICTPLGDQISTAESLYVCKAHFHGAYGHVHSLGPTGSATMEAEEHIAAFAGAYRWAFYPRHHT